MTKKIAARALLTIIFGMGITYTAPMDPNTRMEKVKEIFTKYGADAFKILNGQGIGGTGGESGKGRQEGLLGDIATVVNAEDGNSFIFCVSDGKWVVYPPEPMKVGTDAMTATDAMNRPFVDMMIKALRSHKDNGKAPRIPYAVKTPDGRIQEREATVWNSRNLLSRKNDTGQKFFCGVSVKAHP
jgi:hypothetical protein